MKKLVLISVAAAALLFVGCKGKPADANATETNTTTMESNVTTTEENATGSVTETNVTETNTTETVDSNVTAQ